MNKFELSEIPHHTFKNRQKHILLEEVFNIPVDIAYTDIGQGEVLLLLHGIPTWSYLYHQVIDQLALHYRVIAPDFIGHGWSDHRDLFDRSIEVQAKMIIKLLDALKIEKVHLIGHDTGGGVGLILAIYHASRINKLVLSNIVVYDSWPIDDMISLGNPHWKNKSIKELEEFLLEGYQLGLSNPQKLTEIFKQGITAPYLSNEGKISLIRNASALNTNHTTALVPYHSKITAPTLLLWGEDDPWQKIEDAKQLAKEIPNVKLVSLPNTSHWLQQDAPESYLYHLLQFLKGI